ncbi:MAG TPA: hypothetical protein VK324_18325 [Tepidisphaeraceae bacterium]|nr:hypothetical protein [Tepidisphaeraceae bacterium]
MNQNPGRQSPTPVFKDPVTGTLPTDPVQTATDTTFPDPASAERRWSMTARLFIGVLLLLAVMFVLGVVFRPWG